MAIETRPVKAGLTSVAIGAAAFLAVAAIAGSAKAANYLDNAKPSIWTDPDGCQHYALYNGWQGFMAPRMRPDGTIVCASRPCLVASADQLFATGSYSINADGRRRLEQFFRQNHSSSYVINGHTDNVGGYQYNIRLSVSRANAVASIARSVGAKVTSVQGFGYTKPRASNATASGRAQNRRVEVMCNK
jgi:outer membrane protein OmpA-like peptidoglycan-associated protein